MNKQKKNPEVGHRAQSYRVNRMLPNFKADVLGVNSRDGDSRRALGSYIGTLGRCAGHVELVNIVPALCDDTSPRRL